MRKLLAAALLPLAGCAITPQEMMSRSDYDVCRLTTTPASGGNAQQEARRRGLDCRPYYGAIAANEQAANAATANYLQSIQRPAAPAAPRLSCNTYSIGRQIYTDCR